MTDLRMPGLDGIELLRRARALVPELIVVLVTAFADVETAVRAMHEGAEGAFTGAAGRRDGRFKQADGGTLFLDEIGEISPAIQVKLLRFLQERCFERVGGNETIKVDVRIIAAATRELPGEVAAGKFLHEYGVTMRRTTSVKPPGPQ